jgi:hypothetical protein
MNAKGVDKKARFFYEGMIDEERRAFGDRDTPRCGVLQQLSRPGRFSRPVGHFMARGIVSGYSPSTVRQDKLLACVQCVVEKIAISCGGRGRKLVLPRFAALNTRRLDAQFYRLAQARCSQIGFRAFAKAF